MKHCIIGIMTFLMCMFTTPAMATLTLPIADDATNEQGLMRISGGLTTESDIDMYGGRFTYGVTDDLSVFLGAGSIDIDWIDDIYFQAGGKYQLQGVDVPFDLALRFGFGMVSFEEKESYGSGGSGHYNGYNDDYDDWFYYSSVQNLGAQQWTSEWKTELDIWTINFGLLGSKPLEDIDERLSVYGFGGISYSKVDSKTTTYSNGNKVGSISWDDTDTELAIAGGGIFSLNENFSFYGELAHIDELFISLGARFTF